MTPYLERLSETVIRANYKSLIHARSGVKGAAHAWDKVKGKNCRRYEPRGNAYKRIVQLERDSGFARMKTLLEEFGVKAVQLAAERKAKGE